MVTSGRDNECPCNSQSSEVGAIPLIPKGCGNVEHESRAKMDIAPGKYPSRKMVANDNECLQYPRRSKVSAVRSFPDGCGNVVSSRNTDNAPRIYPSRKMAADGQDNEFPQYPKRLKVSAVRLFPKGCRNVEHVSRVNRDSSPRNYPRSINVKGRVKQDFDFGRGTNIGLRGFSGKGDFRVGCKSQSLDHLFYFNDQKNSIIEVVKPLKFYNGLRNSDRDKVKRTLDLFQEILSMLMQGKEQKHVAKTVTLSKVASILRGENQWINTSKRLGSVPGIQVGDKFQWRYELQVIGLHQHHLHGIVYMKKGGKIFATSVVESGRYDANDGKSCNHMIYSGEGGNPKVWRSSTLKDQKLKRGNLALKNSMEAKSPVRVIRAIKSFDSSDSTGGSSRKKNNVVYVYDGLYLVDSYWQKRGPFGKLVFKFLLKRSLGQEKSGLIEMRGTKQCILKKDDI